MIKIFKMYYNITSVFYDWSSNKLLGFFGVLALVLLHTTLIIYVMPFKFSQLLYIGIYIVMLCLSWYSRERCNIWRNDNT